MDQCEVIPNYSILFFFPLFPSTPLVSFLLPISLISLSYQFLPLNFSYISLSMKSVSLALCSSCIYIYIFFFPVSHHSYSYSLSFQSLRNPTPSIKKQKQKLLQFSFLIMAGTTWNHHLPTLLLLLTFLLNKLLHTIPLILLHLAVQKVIHQIHRDLNILQV